MLNKTDDCLKYKASERVALLPKDDHYDTKPYDIKDGKYTYIYDYSNQSIKFQSKNVSFPIKIKLTTLKNWSASNCVFSEDVIIVIDNDDVDSSVNFGCCIFESRLIFLGESNDVSPSVLGRIVLDNCSMKELSIRNIVVIEFYTYKSDLPKIVLENRKVNKFRSESSNIGVFYINGCKVQDVSLPSDDLKKYKFIYNGIYKQLLKYNKDKINDKNHVLSQAFSAVDVFLGNRNVGFSQADMAKILYERSYLQNIKNNNFLRSILWLFGYFQKPTRYIITGLTLWVCVALSIWLYANFWSHNASINISEAARLAFSSSFGLSYTLKESAINSLGISFIVSSAIGVGTIFYSALLVTLLNRFRLNL